MNDFEDECFVPEEFVAQKVRAKSSTEVQSNVLISNKGSLKGKDKHDFLLEFKYGCVTEKSKSARLDTFIVERMEKWNTQFKKKALSHLSEDFEPCNEYSSKQVPTWLSPKQNSLRKRFDERSPLNKNWSLDEDLDLSSERADDEDKFNLVRSISFANNNNVFLAQERWATEEVKVVTMGDILG